MLISRSIDHFILAMVLTLTAKMALADQAAIIRECTNLALALKNGTQRDLSEVVLSTKIEDFCKIESDEVQRIRDSAKNLEGGYKGFSLGYGDDVSDTEIRKKHISDCGHFSSVDYRISTDNTAYQEFMVGSQILLSECVALAREQKLPEGFLISSFQYREDKEDVYLINYAFIRPSGLTNTDVNLLKFTNVEPARDVNCTIGKKRVKDNFKPELSSGTMTCVTSKPIENLAISTNWGTESTKLIPRVKGEYSKLRVSVAEFYRSAQVNAWPLIEVELFSPKGEKIGINRLESSSCFGGCPISFEPGQDVRTYSANLAALIDGNRHPYIRLRNDGSGDLDQSFYWAPGNFGVDDAGETLTLHFEKSEVSEIRISQWSGGSCMANCNPPHEGSDYGRNARFISYQFDDGEEFLALSGTDTADLTVVVSQ